MPHQRVIRYLSADDLADGLARRLVRAILHRQDTQGEVHLCVAGGRAATRVYEYLHDVDERTSVDPSRLHVWWSDDAFVPTGDVQRTSLRTLPLLLTAFHLDPSRTHPIPTMDGKDDADDAAYAYAQELGNTIFDICLLDVGESGAVASLFADDPSFSPHTTALAVGVTASPTPTTERISLTLPEINRSHQVWLIASGAHKAKAVNESLLEGSQLPAALARGTEETLWWTDQLAAAQLPSYNCSL